MRWRGLIEEYQEFLPVNEQTPKLTLNEGNTPLIKLDRLSAEWGVELYVKTEGTNPTGSFKDRGMVMAVAKAKEEGSDTVICASTGNTSASCGCLCCKSRDEMHRCHSRGKDCDGETCASSHVWGRNNFY